MCADGEQERQTTKIIGIIILKMKKNLNDDFCHDFAKCGFASVSEPWVKNNNDLLPTPDINS